MRQDYSEQQHVPVQPPKDTTYKLPHSPVVHLCLYHSIQPNYIELRNVLVLPPTRTTWQIRQNLDLCLVLSNSKSQDYIEHRHSLSSQPLSTTSLLLYNFFSYHTYPNNNLPLLNVLLPPFVFSFLQPLFAWLSPLPYVFLPLPPFSFLLLNQLQLSGQPQRNHISFQALNHIF